MVVCHCLAVNDRGVLDAADGARTVEEVIARCGAGTRCGGCRPVLSELLAGMVAGAETLLGDPITRRRTAA